MDVYTIQDYKSGLKPVWCPGCGNYAILSALIQALTKLQLPPEEVAIISGIGCSSRLPGYVKVYGFNSIHGRTLPVAQGVKLARPKTTVIAVAGDGDAFSIGNGHLLHEARRNIDLTYIIMDNSIYGMTKGQSSPTTGTEQITKTTPYGFLEEPINPLKIALSYGITFIARGFSGNVKQTTDLIVKGIEHPGFSFIQILSPCVTFVGKEQYNIIRSKAEDLGTDYDATSVENAWEISNEVEKTYMGVIYNVENSIYCERLRNVKKIARHAGNNKFESLLKKYSVF